MKIQVGVFFGGRSVEHEVSVISAQQVLAALDRSKYDPVPVYLGKDGRWFTGPRLLGVENFLDLPALRAACTEVTPSLSPGDGRLLPARPGLFGRGREAARLDAALVVMHGSFGEDGCLQGLFELMDLPYTGCDVAASALGMDKVAAKRIWSAAGLPVVPGIEFESRAWFADPAAGAARVEAELGFPVVIKPSNLGSSVGLNTAGDGDALRAGVEATARFTHRILVERRVTPLRELNCAVLGDVDGAEASVCEEPVRTSEVLSFTDKYASGGKGGGKSGGGMHSLKRELPAKIPEALADRVRDLARRAFLALRCAGVARVDFLYCEPSDEVFVNEINTIPGSLSFYLWEAGGLPFPALLDRLLDLAFKRKRDRDRISFSYDTNLLAGMGGGKGGAKR